jgi:hypothetical protein
LERASDVLLARADERFKSAIREWVRLDLEESYPLTGGISGADVHYVRATISFPGLSVSPVPVTFVVKFSTKRTFKIEQGKYSRLRDDLKQYFMNFSSPAKQIDSEFYMVMEHLSGFKSLETLLYKTPLECSPKSLMEGIIPVLKKMYFDSSGEGMQSIVSRRFNMYFGEIEQSISIALDQHTKILKPLYDQKVNVNGVPMLPLKTCFTEISKRSSDFEPKYTTLMHGDCHARNIMVNPVTHEMKFIDIDKLTNDGDYVYDVGELLADLEIFGYILGARRFCVTQEDKQTYHYSIEPPQAVRESAETLTTELLSFAREDENRRESRLKLSQARYLLNMLPNLEVYQKDRILATYFEATRIMNELAARN